MCRPSKVFREGIAGMSQRRTSNTRKRSDMSIKLLAIMKQKDRQIEVRVHPDSHRKGASAREGLG